MESPVTSDVQGATTTTGWFTQLKEWYNSVIQKVTWEWVAEVGFALCIGFFGGFLLKKYGKQLFVTIISVIIVLAALHYMHVVTIEWTVLKETTGVDSVGTVESTLQRFIDLAKDHVVAVVAAIVGFFIGYKVG